MSPDETKISFSIFNSRSQNIWLYDIKRKINTRFTLSSTQDGWPIWSPDGKWIVFNSNRKNGKKELYLKSSNGSGNIIQLTNTGKDKFPIDWSSDNKYIGFSQLNIKTKADVYILPISNIPDTGYIKPKALFDSKFTEYGPLFSPDNKWIIFATDESGQFQLYVSPFLNITGGKWQVSTLPSTLSYIGWSSDGKGIYYQSENNKVIYVEANPIGNEFNVGKSSEIFDIPYSGRAKFCGFTKDNKHFLFLIPIEGSQASYLTVVTNWNKKIKRVNEQ